MHFEGKILVKAPREKVWSFVSSPHEIAKCIPGLKSYEVLEGKKVTAKVKAGIGFIKGTFNVKTKFLEEEPEKHHAKLSIGGSGVSSSFESTVDVRLEEVDEGTNIVWSADATLSGMLGSVAEKMIEGTLNKTVNKMFECIKKSLEEAS